MLIGPRILFLYTELADYTIGCLRALKLAEPKAKIVVIHYPINSEAPFSFDYAGIGDFKSIVDFKSYHDLKSYVRAFEPEKIVCSGWNNTRYVRICNKYRRNATCILVMDNHWNGSVKQRLLRLFSRLLLTRIFKKVWVPGRPQFQYAKILGFEDESIVTGFYCCDVNYFDRQFKKHRNRKCESFPHRFLCVARYTHPKGYPTLWDAFIEWKKRSNNDWELWCAGTGEGYASRTIHSSIRHLGFVQKEKWEEVIANTGVFVLSSIYEPWGVVVQELAAAGYPLLLSDRVGAASEFLSTQNGFLFDPSDREQLINQFQLISELSTAQLMEMSKLSNKRAFIMTPDKWASELLSM